jgi:hypothetical protein
MRITVTTFSCLAVGSAIWIQIQWWKNYLPKVFSIKKLCLKHEFSSMSMESWRFQVRIRELKFSNLHLLLGGTQAVHVWLGSNFRPFFWAYEVSTFRAFDDLSSNHGGLGLDSCIAVCFRIFVDQRKNHWTTSFSNPEKRRKKRYPMSVKLLTCASETIAPW